MILGSVTQDSFWVTSLSALAVVLKGWSDFKKFLVKVDMCHFALTTYTKTLTELRNYVRGLSFDEDGFLINMQTLDDIIRFCSPFIRQGRIVPVFSTYPPKLVLRTDNCKRPSCMRRVHLC